MKKEKLKMGTPIHKIKWPVFKPKKKIKKKFTFVTHIETFDLMGKKIRTISFSFNKFSDFSEFLDNIEQFLKNKKIEKLSDYHGWQR